ncbi:g8128 [Coccomyxa viridis]|uniref:G8128 protein n=1 Tax=Coccomyxa viridis TaxID=1274662 RepID=A0ABP1FZM2_9CHLO
MAPFAMPEAADIAEMLGRTPREPRTIRLHTDNLERVRRRGLDVSDVDGTLVDLHAAGKPSTVKTKHLRDLSEHIDRGYDGSTLTDRQKENWIGWDDIIGRRRELDAAVEGDHGAGTMYDHLLLTMYSVLPPARNDYCGMEVVRDRKRVPRNSNYYIVNNGGQDVMVLNKYKTSKHYGQRRVSVPEQVQDVVRKSLDRVPRKYLFAHIKDTDKPWTSQYTTNRMGKVFPGKRWGSALMRKIVTTEFANRKKGSRMALAKAMGHRLDTSERYYNDVDKTVPNDMGIIL